MDFDERVFARQYYVVFRSIPHIAYNRGLKAAWDGAKNHSSFQASTLDSHLLLATIDWCNVFGSRKGDMHWTKTTAGEIPRPVQEDFRQSVSSGTGFILEECKKYQRDMPAFEISLQHILIFVSLLQIQYQTLTTRFRQLMPTTNG